MTFVPGQVIISVRGGRVVSGGAPLDLIVEKVQTVQSLFYRTAEFLKELPHRTRGGPTKEIQDVCRPWLFQGVAASYQFSVVVEEPVQASLFDEPRPSVRELTSRFLQILRASVEDPKNDLPRVVSDPAYRRTFLNLTRNLTPTGKAYQEMEVRSAGDTAGITMFPGVRQVINAAIRGESRPPEPGFEHEQSIRGILRAIHLDHDWIDVTTVEGTTVHIIGVGEAVDDVIGPMMNRPVIVRSTLAPKGRYRFIDIEPEE